MSADIEKVFLGEKLVAVHVLGFPDGKVTPISSEDGALQLMTMKRAKGDAAKAHRHIPKKRETTILQECLIVLKGSVRYDLFDEAGKCFKEIFVREGEAILILGVGHAVHFLEDSEVYELKNGPFIDDKVFIEWGVIRSVFLAHYGLCAIDLCVYQW